MPLSGSDLRTVAGLWLCLLCLLTLPVVGRAQYTYTTNDGTITIIGYAGPGGGVVIPDTIDELPVTSIGDFAFSYRTSLTSVTIPNGVITIGDFAFSDTSLTNVTIPNSVTSVGAYAFNGCKSLTNVTIGNGVTTIKYAPFVHCTSLSTITVDALNSSYSSVDGVLFDKSRTLLILFPEGKAGGYTIPNSVTRIGNDAFFGCSLTNVTIPNSVTSIGYYAFNSCTSLTNVTIPNSVTSIDHGTFSSCFSLTSVTIPNSVTWVGPYAFNGCKSLTSVTIPDGVTSIGYNAFSSCTSLTSITIPNSVMGIWEYAFSDCTSLTSVTIPNGVTSIGIYAFSSCTNLTGVYFQGNAPNVDGSVFDLANNVTVYYLPGTTGWGTTFAGRPAVLWNPLVATGEASFGVRTNRFGFTITGASNLVLVVEAATNLANPAWVPVGTNTLMGGASYFSDREWTNYPSRIYRIRSQ